MSSTTIYNARCAYCDAPLGKRRVKNVHKNTFCNSSHAAKFNNRGVRRHGNPPNDCLNCGTKTSSFQSKYCSNKCQGEYVILQRWGNKEKHLQHKAAMNREAVARYEARKKNQTPELSKEELKSIQKFYENCPEGYEVDHIYPISKGGYHVLSNLQYLTITENRKKQNKVLDNTSPMGYNIENRKRTRGATG